MSEATYNHQAAEHYTAALERIGRLLGVNEELRAALARIAEIAHERGARIIELERLIDEQEREIDIADREPARG